MIRPKLPSDGRHNLDRWLLTYADMITLLTAFFLMLYSMSVMSKGKFTALASSVRNGFGGPADSGPSLLNGGGARTSTAGPHPEGQEPQYEQAMSNFSQFVEQNKLGDKISKRADERGMVISLLSDGMLFERGNARLKPQSGALLAKVAAILKSVPNNVQVEGHTCDLPIRTALFPSNWELSSARAGAVLREFVERDGLAGNRFIAAGYADTKPLAPNTNEVNRARNRRVDIVVLRTEAQRAVDLRQKSEFQRITAPPAGGN